MEGRYALFDFWAETRDEFTAKLGDAIDYLHSLGLKLILAHPERVVPIQQDPASVDWVLERGISLQMNTWCLTAPTESPIYRLARDLLQAGKYTLFGTDCHDPESMPRRIEGITVAEKLVGTHEVDCLTRTNPVLLSQAALQPAPITDVKA
jgi:protein-tyrosine phosphatase